MPIRLGSKNFHISTPAIGNWIISSRRGLVCPLSIAALILFCSTLDASAWKEKTSKNCWRICHSECDGPLGICTSRKTVCDEEKCIQTTEEKKPSAPPPSKQSSPPPPPPAPVAAPAPPPAPPVVPAGRCRQGYVYSTAQGVCVPGGR